MNVLLGIETFMDRVLERTVRFSYNSDGSIDGPIVNSGTSRIPNDEIRSETISGEDIDFPLRGPVGSSFFNCFSSSSYIIRSDPGVPITLEGEVVEDLKGKLKEVDLDKKEKPEKRAIRF